MTINLPFAVHLPAFQPKTLCLFILLFFLPLSTFGTDNVGYQQPIKKLLNLLPGIWDGQAITTPIGPVNYDLVFYNCRDDLIAGVAKTNASLHYWQFHTEKDALKLRFLSTFGGNRKPVWLIPNKVDLDAIHFYAPALGLLTVSVGITMSDQVNINIYHYGKHHVHILLNQDKNGRLAANSAQTKEESCRGSPE